MRRVGLILVVGLSGACTDAPPDSKTDAGETHGDAEPSPSGDARVDVEKDAAVAAEPDGGAIDTGMGEAGTPLDDGGAGVVTGEPLDLGNGATAVLPPGSPPDLQVSATPINSGLPALPAGDVLGPAFEVKVTSSGSLSQPVLVTFQLGGASYLGVIQVVEVRSGEYGAPLEGIIVDGSTVTFPVTGTGTYAAVTRSPVVCEQGFESGSITGFEIAGEARLTGQLGARPPILAAGGSAEYVFNCGGQPHTELEFASYGGVATLWVDGLKYDDTPNTGWNTHKLTVPLGVHEYRWRVTVSSQGRPNFLLDDIKGSAITPRATGGGGNFDQSFVPPEFTGFGGAPSTSWQIVSDGALEGGYSARPPILAAGGSAILGFACANQEHSGLEFKSYGGAAELWVDGVKYTDVPNTGWNTHAIVVPFGKHSYEFRISSTSAGRPNFLLDSVKCTGDKPADNSTLLWGFDTSFVPTEFTGFGGAPSTSWQIVSDGALEGGYSARPPILAAGGSATLGFACAGKQHSALEFKSYGGAAELWVDGAKYADVPNTGWNTHAIVVPFGEHNYEWRISSTSAGRPNFLLDSVKCTDDEPANSGTDLWGFDTGFVPPEFTGFGGAPSTNWQIVSDGALEGGYSARPPILAAGGSATLGFGCADKSHSALEFKSYGGAAELWVDGAKYADVPNTGWNTHAIVVPFGKHSYEFRISSTSAGRPNFLLDTVKCTATQSAANGTLLWGFDTGFVPTEFSGFGGAPSTSWQIVSDGALQGGYSARPPILTAGGRADLSFNCGGAAHTSISFASYGGVAELLLDGVKLADVPNTGWDTRSYGAPARAAHTWTWRVSQTSAGRPNFLLDTVTCVP